MEKINYYSGLIVKLNNIIFDLCIDEHRKEMSKEQREIIFDCLHEVIKTLVDIKNEIIRSKNLPIRKVKMK